MRAGIRARAAVALLVLAGAALAAPVATNPVMPPPDAGTPPPAVERMLHALRGIVAARDVQALLAHVVDGTTWSFGGDHGHAGFRTMWREGDDLARFWAELEQVLALPGRWEMSAEGSSYCTPYVYCDALPPGLDPYDAMVVLGTGVALRARPDAAAPALARLDHAVLQRRQAADAPEGWVPVRTAAGLEGHVDARLVRSPVDYRLGIALDVDGGWHLEYFVAGD